MKVILVQNVEILGRPYYEGQDISNIDPGNIQSLIGAGWAKVVKEVLPLDDVPEKQTKKKNNNRSQV